MIYITKNKEELEMKKIFILFLCGLIVISPYSFNSKAFVSADENSISLEQVSESDSNNADLAFDEDLVHLTESEVLVDELVSQINDIKENLEIIDQQAVDQELLEIIEEIKLIDIESMVSENILQQSKELNLENADSVINSLENIGEEIVVEEEIVENESVDFEGEVIPDEVFEDNYDSESAEDLLISSDVSLNIVTTEGEETIIQDISEFVEELVVAKEKAANSIFKKDIASASNSGYGYFFAAHNVAVVDMKTTKAKFVNIGTFTKTGGILKPVSLSMNLVNKRKTTSSGSYTNVISRTVNATKGRDYKVESPISKTYFWNATAKFTGTFKDGSKDTTLKTSKRFLLNKKGVLYPVFKDPKSKKVMSEPASTTWTKKYYPEAWTTAKRNNYKKWYEPKYGKLTWTDYEVHHIRPRVYYGSNDYSNLIPLKTSYHRGIVSPWWTNY